MSLQAIACLFTASSIATVAWATTTVGTIPGQFAVSETGAATYTIPIQVPPGIAGLEPKLSLTYNSQGGNGLLGVGWSLSGLSAITRCPRTIIQDGAKAGVEYSNNDKYCLDGQRLVATTGTYGADGTEYRTELESFTKVISYGSAGNGPAWFKVWTKSGQVVEYGNTADSRIEAQGKTTVAIWAVNKIRDTKGNYLTVTYTEDNPNGQYYPARIDYTGNANTAQAPTNSVLFVYETRPDVVPMYQAGSLSKNTVRMMRVLGYVGAINRLDYQLIYEQSVSTGSSYMSSLTKCDGGGMCLNPTVFQYGGLYQLVSFGFARSLPGASVATSSYLDGNKGIITGDWNGDGRTDMLHLHPAPASQYSWVALSNGDGTFAFSRSLPGASAATNSYLDVYQNVSYITAGDWNGDGKTDLLHLQPLNPDPQYSWVALSNGDGTFNFSRSLPGSSAATSSYLDGNQIIITGDWNGDGKMDMLHLHPDPSPQYSWVALSNGDGTFTFSHSLPGASVATNSYLDIHQNVSYITTGDWNGDGKTDLLHLQPLNPDPQYSWVALSNGDGTFNFSRSLPGSSAATSSYLDGNLTIVTGDWNGDGNTDMLHLHPAPASQYSWVALSKGDGTFAFSKSLPGASAATNSYLDIYQNVSYMTAGDWNGDGKTDLLHLQPNSDPQYSWVALSNGDGTFDFSKSLPGASIATNSYLDGNQDIITGDWNGDGKVDFLHLHPNQDQKYSWVSVSLPASLITMSAVIDGLNSQISFFYEPISFPSAYTREETAVYPIQDVQAPVYVVTSVQRPNGLGGQSETTYHYAGAKTHMQGRGFLGFREVSATDTQTGLTTTTEYLQDYPYIGLPSRITKTTGGGTLIYEQDTTYAAQTLGGTRYFPYAAQSVESRYDLDASLMASTTTSNQYDAYGNATQISVVSNDGHSKVTVNQYDNDVTNWILGRLKRATVTSTTP